MTIAVSLIVGAVVVPSPGRALLDRVHAPSALLLAQSPDVEAEAELERDMERAREHLGHGKRAQRKAPQADGDSDTQPSAAGQGDAIADDEQPRRERKKKRQRRRRWPEGVARPMVDGHGKGHYLGWGIADWGIAGALFVGTSVFGASSALSAAAASRVNPQTKVPYPFESRREYKQALRTTAVIYGAAAVVGAGLGTMLAFKASRNLRTYRELKEQEQLILQKHGNSP